MFIVIIVRRTFPAEDRNSSVSVVIRLQAVKREKLDDWG
jgi:hypothetical protein